MRTLRAVACLLALFAVVSFSSCAVYDILGIDTHDYTSETSIAMLDSDSEVAKELLDIVPMMVQNSPYLSEFDTPSEAAELYRDSILCFILARNFAKYNANTELIEETREQYPTYELTTVIPALDFESTVYRYFGGTASVSNSSTKLFTYLDKVDAYVSVGIGVDSNADVEITELYETENTYVCTFKCTMNNETSPLYRILLMKRDDGTFYIKSLQIEKAD
ncbi:MAG: hypothetical protein IJN48_00040 [Clostridia bacterium]|nr:hypothetical protein [Clostridia bacterium]